MYEVEMVDAEKMVGVKTVVDIVVVVIGLE